jgi:hypothetical protein
LSSAIRLCHVFDDGSGHQPSVVDEHVDTSPTFRHILDDLDALLVDGDVQGANPDVGTVLEALFLEA